MWPTQKTSSQARVPIQCSIGAATRVKRNSQPTISTGVAQKALRTSTVIGSARSWCRLVLMSRSRARVSRLPAPARIQVVRPSAARVRKVAGALRTYATIAGPWCRHRACRRRVPGRSRDAAKVTRPMARAMTSVTMTGSREAMEVRTGPSWPRWAYRR